MSQLFWNTAGDIFSVEEKAIAKLKKAIFARYVRDAGRADRYAMDYFAIKLPGSGIKKLGRC